GGVAPDLGHRRRPDRRRHWVEMILAEGRTIVRMFEIVGERERVERSQVARCLAIETQQIAQHVPEPRAERIASLREQGRPSRAGIFEAAVVERDGERHIGSLGYYTEMGKQGREIGI